MTETEKWKRAFMGAICIFIGIGVLFLVLSLILSFFTMDMAPFYCYCGVLKDLLGSGATYRVLIVMLPITAGLWRLIVESAYDF